MLEQPTFIIKAARVTIPMRRFEAHLKLPLLTRIDDDLTIVPGETNTLWVRIGFTLIGQPMDTEIKALAQPLLLHQPLHPALNHQVLFH